MSPLNSQQTSKDDSEYPFFFATMTTSSISDTGAIHIDHFTTSGLVKCICTHKCQHFSVPSGCFTYYKDFLY